MTSGEIREKYLEFFRGKGHTILPSASLIPENDPTVLFTTAGMQPLVPFFLGEKHPGGQRLADIQKCLRTDDIDEVGDVSHHTFFEMLGNWSLGDYWKDDSIAWSLEFLTSAKWLGLDKNKLAVSVFEGDADAPKDTESRKIWLELGIPEERLRELGKEDNWWGPAGEAGPCGPDTEIFYWTSAGNPPVMFEPSDKRWSEIWNNVFMEYEKTREGKFKPLAKKNVDTGMGLERILTVLNGLDDDYRTDVFWPIIQKLEELSEKKYGENLREFRIIADHLKAATFILSEDSRVNPSNTGQGYIVRRLIRRAVVYGRQLGIKESFWTKQISETIREIYKNVYPELGRNKEFVVSELDKEEEKFAKTLERGLKYFDLILKKTIHPFDGGMIIPQVGITANHIFDLYQNYGFPPEMFFEELDRRGISYDKKYLTGRLKEKLEEHQELSRTSSAGMFKGGLAHAGEKTTRLHTATHLLLASLRQILGPEVFQRGSNITAERLRFDFSFPRKLDEKELRQVEDLVNEKISENLPVTVEEMTLEEAKEQKAIGVFESKYGERVKVYTIGSSTDPGFPFSREICGGPHASRTSEIGEFKIIKEEAVSRGIRRLRAHIL